MRFGDQITGAEISARKELAVLQQVCHDGRTGDRYKITFLAVSRLRL